MLAAATLFQPDCQNSTAVSYSARLKMVNLRRIGRRLQIYSLQLWSAPAFQSSTKIFCKLGASASCHCMHSWRWLSATDFRNCNCCSNSTSLYKCRRLADLLHMRTCLTRLSMDAELMLQKHHSTMGKGQQIRQTNGISN